MKSEKFDDLLHGIVSIGSALAFIGVVYFATNENNSRWEDIEKRRKILYEQVMQRANSNKDNMTDHSEWGSVYATLKRHYDVHNSNPSIDLSDQELNKYLRLTN